MGPSRVRGQVRYHRRYRRPTPFFVAAFIVLAFSVPPILEPSGLMTFFVLTAVPILLILIYLDGLTKSVTVQNDTLIVRNSAHRYEIPTSRILYIESMEYLGVFVHVEDHSPIRVGVFSRNRFQTRRLSRPIVDAYGMSLVDALFDTPVPDDQRRLKVTYRWVNVFLYAVVVACFLVMLWVADGPPLTVSR